MAESGTKYFEIRNKPGMQFRRALLKLSKQLRDQDLEEMKFLIAGLPDKPGFAELEVAKSPMAFFSVLTNYTLISEEDYKLLEYLLNEIGQIVLIAQFKDYMKNNKQTSSPSVSSTSSSSQDSAHSSPSSSLEYTPNTSNTNQSSDDSGISSSSNHTISPEILPQSSSAEQNPPLASSTPIRGVSVRAKTHNEISTYNSDITATQRVTQLTQAPQPPSGLDINTESQNTTATQSPLAISTTPPRLTLSQDVRPKSNQTPMCNSDLRSSQYSGPGTSRENLPQNTNATQSPPLATSTPERPGHSISAQQKVYVESPCVNADVSATQRESTVPQSSRSGINLHNLSHNTGAEQSPQPPMCNNLSATPQITDSTQALGLGISAEKLPHMTDALQNNPLAPTTPLTQERLRQNVPPRPHMHNHDLSTTLNASTIPQSSGPGISPEKLPLSNNATQNPLLPMSTPIGLHVTPQSSVLSHQSTAHPNLDPYNSFDIRPLTSNDIPGLGFPLGYDLLGRSMPEPNSSDMGPTILSPSVSFQDVGNQSNQHQAPIRSEQSRPVIPPLSIAQDAGYQGNSQAPDGCNRISPMGPPMSTEYQAPSIAEQPMNRSEEHVGSLHLQQGDGSLLANKGSLQSSASDLETDGPDEEMMGTCHFEIPCHDQFHHRGRSSHSEPCNAVQPRQQNGSVENEDGIENIKQELRKSLVEQQARKAQGYHEPAAEVIKKDTEKQIKLRGYQKEVIERAKDGQNYIDCAPTGSGKTLTAAFICRNRYDKAKEKGDRFKSLFLVPLRHLTEQQMTAFREVFPDGTVATVGETDRLSKIFYLEAYAVIMVTSQILLNALKKKEPEINLGDISMIIFDECHHATQNHPYNEIMKIYMKNKKLKLGSEGVVGKSGRYLPYILGLSASLGVGHGKDAYHHILTLCANLDAADVIQVVQNKAELKKFVNSPEQDEILYVRPRISGNGGLCAIIEKIMSEVECVIWPSGVLERHGTDTYEQWCVLRRKEAEQSQERIHIVACLYLFEFNRALLLYDELRAVDAVRHLEAFVAKRDLKQNPVAIEKLCREYVRCNLEKMRSVCRDETDSDNPKLDQLGKQLRKTFEGKPDSKGIILVRTRVGTEAITEFIEETPVLRGLCVKPVRLVGQGTDTETEKYMTEHEQRVSLKKFREDKSCNVLVATDIAQEGLDMPACNFVIRYNFVSNEIGTVQSKGRARAEQSECFLIVEENSKIAERELQNHQNVKDMQEAMDRLNAMSEEQRIVDITKRQDGIYKEMVRQEEKIRTKKGIHDPENVKLLCKECNQYITKASFIRTKGCHYTCVDPNIKERIKIVRGGRRTFKTTVNTGTFKCAKNDCGQPLGTAIDFLDVENIDQVKHKGYGFKADSFLFMLPEGLHKTYKKWNLVTFDIPEHEE